MVDFTILPEPVELKDPTELVRFGWAPGGYIAKCFECRTHHQGAAKRSSKCQPCAFKAKKEFEEAPPVPQSEHHPETVTIAKPYRLLFNDKGQHIGYLWDPD